MTFDSGSAAIAMLAWERELGLADGALAASGSERLVRVAEDAATATFLRLCGHSALVAPAAIATAGAALDDGELADHSALMRISRPLGGRGLGIASLYFADDLPLRQPARELVVSHADADRVALEALCPPDDVHEAALGALPHRFTLLDDDGPLACAAYGEVQGLLAPLGVLVAPGHRRQGWGQLAAAIASHEALASGLLLQGRAEASNIAANRLARSLGLEWAGTHTSVLLR